ncbi:MAG: argininosuccinate lyase [Bdellovibrionales bacterium]|nr:argininosuccinate lyase [Bdellovibrionales bacterium]
MTKSKKIWQKAHSSLHPAVTDYMVQDIAEDNRLVPYDVMGSIAHAQMLAKVGLLTKSESKKIVSALKEIPKLHQQGKFVIHPENEDVHTEIENFLVKKLGVIGKKVHVGRSRNDQVLTAMRLYSKAELSNTNRLLIALCKTLLGFAKRYEFVAMPGFTHMQHAMPSSVGQWSGAFLEALLNDSQVLQAAFELNNQNPLGSAAGFGTAVPIDRAETTRLLGFSRVQLNAMYCQNSRGKIEAFTISCLLQIMLSLGKIANDLVIMCSQEFSFFKVADQLTTGSSIMPQKKNLDIMEMLRANVSIVQSLQLQCQTVGMNLLSGYNKDSQITKKALMDSIEITKSSLGICDLLFKNLKPQEENLRKAFDDHEIFAADYTNELVIAGASFRDAYQQVGNNLHELTAQDPLKNIKSKKHLGAPGNLRLQTYSAWIKRATW